MKITINQQPFELQSPACVQEALTAMVARPPFAVAVNTQFVPQAQYATYSLHEGDCVEVISPVTGG